MGVVGGGGLKAQNKCMIIALTKTGCVHSHMLTTMLIIVVMSALEFHVLLSLKSILYKINILYHTR